MKRLTSDKIVPRAVTVTALAFAVLIPSIVHAEGTDDPIHSFYEEPGLATSRDYEHEHAQEHIDPFTGKLQWHHVDLVIPGNGGFDLKVQRSYSSLGDDPIEFRPFGAGWIVHFGRLIVPTGASVCLIGTNPVFELPDGSRQVFYRADAWPTSMTFVSTNYWAGRCADDGNAFVVYSPDGTTYRMDAVAPGGRYPSKITDRNGNWMAISYTMFNNYLMKPTSVTTNDGRSITFSYGAVTKICGGASCEGAQNTWEYHVTPSANPYVSLLTAVVRPDGERWSYSYNPSGEAGNYSIKQVTYPTGGVGQGTLTYSYDYLWPGQGLPRSHIVKGKTSADNGNWTYSYLPATEEWPDCGAPRCPFDYLGHPQQFDKTTVVAPEGTTTYFHFGYNSARGGTVYLIGSLLVKLLGAQAEGYSYDYAPISTEVVQRPYSVLADFDTNAPRVVAKDVNRYGQTYNTQIADFDNYGNPATIRETGTDQRTTTVTYFVDPARWIIRRKRNESTDTIGQTLREIDPNGNVRSETRYGVATQFTYTAEGDMATKTDARQQTITYANYKRGIPQHEAHPEGVTIDRVVSDHGNIISETDGESATTGYDYDGLNRLTAIRHPYGNPVAIVWGHTSKTVTRGNYRETTNFDGFGRAVSVQHTGGAGGAITQTYDYDASGRRVFASYPNASTGTAFVYDILGQPTQLLHGWDPATQTGLSERLYGYVNNTVRMTNERDKVFTYTYRGYGDPDRRDLMAVTAPEPTASQAFTRNGLGQVTAVTQGGRTRSYGYDGRYFLTSDTNPEIGVTTYGRDAVGNMTSRQVGTSAMTTFGYDGRNRLTSIAYPLGTPSVSRGYYKDDKPRFVDSGIGRRDYLYNPNKDLTTETLTVDGQAFVTRYGYDGNDALATLTYGSGKKVDYAPDGLGWPTQAVPYLTAVSHHPSGQTSTLRYANGVQTTVAFNAFNWPNKLDIVSAPNPPASTPLFDQTYFYDNTANVIGIADAIDARYNRGMSYDGIDRPTFVHGSWGSGTLNYDGRGNIQNTGFGTFTLGYTYDPETDRLTGVEGTKKYALSYDAYGNVVGNGSATFAYDDASSMRCAKCGTVDQISYDYDGLNQRVRAQQNGLTTYFVHDSTGKLLWEQTPGLGIKEYVYLNGKQVAVRQQTP